MYIHSPWGLRRGYQQVEKGSFMRRVGKIAAAAGAAAILLGTATGTAGAALPGGSDGTSWQASTSHTHVRPGDGTSWQFMPGQGTSWHYVPGDGTSWQYFATSADGTSWQ
jgi:hypothetical protein